MHLRAAFVWVALALLPTARLPVQMFSPLISRLPPPGNPAWYLNLITGHHTSDTYQACNVTAFYSASPSTTAYGTCTRIDTVTGGRIPAKIGIYFSGSSAVSSIQITVNPSGGPASSTCSGNVDQQTFCNPGQPGWYCLTGGGTQYGYAFIMNS